MCMGPFMCRTRTGDCCGLIYKGGRLICPIRCNLNNNRQTDVADDQGGYSIDFIFKTTFVTTLLFNIFTNIGTTTSVTISLYFEYFDLEYHSTCIYDFIEGKMNRDQR